MKCNQLLHMAYLVTLVHSFHLELLALFSHDLLVVTECEAGAAAAMSSFCHVSVFSSCSPTWLFSLSANLK